MDPDITPVYGPPPSIEEQARGAAAHDRPRPHVTEPPAVDPQWWDRLFREMDLESLLANARAFHRARRYWEQPGWGEIASRLNIARAEIWDAMDQHPGSHLLEEYYRQVYFALMGRHFKGRL